MSTENTDIDFDDFDILFQSFASNCSECAYKTCGMEGCDCSCSGCNCGDETDTPPSSTSPDPCESVQYYCENPFAPETFNAKLNPQVNDLIDQCCLTTTTPCPYDICTVYQTVLLPNEQGELEGFEQPIECDCCNISHQQSEECQECSGCDAWEPPTTTTGCAQRCHEKSIPLSNQWGHPIGSISICELDNTDIVRNPIIGKILSRLEELENERTA